VFVALVVQVTTIVLLLLLPPRLPSFQDTTEFRTAIQASQQFIIFWILVWVAWLALYAIWLVYWRAVTSSTVPEPIHLALDLCNILSSAFLLLCYFSMVLRTVPPETFGWHGVVTQVIVLFVALVVGESIITAVVASDSNHVEVAKHFFDWIEGLIGGIALALFVGRLDSRFIQTSRWIIAILYIYAIIQLSYPQLEANNPQKALFFC
jgi:hypothetical protein